ncbi:hypothetical protein Psi02_77420 [Planotetraspora silvatica]|uniref:Uncharacterized protein n=1 Tax=Planotetraspora silvatica TaxID=234614 RepID=A0A8J3XW55_9ACTN|nr:hypothetical protein [Planotetraspora silvatica]GII51318.1 hypothetical protein Psi02_77420 [Planotetraspora silvatica]
MARLTASRYRSARTPPPSISTALGTELAASTSPACAGLPTRVAAQDNGTAVDDCCAVIEPITHMAEEEHLQGRYRRWS